MVLELPANAPKTTNEAFAYVGELSKGATIDDLKILALVEAIGEELYNDLAGRAENPQVQELLRANGREEMVHAQRVSKALEILTGKSFPIPPLSEIPFFTPLSRMPITAEALGALAAAELAGADLYAGVASSFDNPEAVALFQQNGKEEIQHGHRLQRAAELLAQ